MNKLWQKENTAVAAQVERFTIGKDLYFDLQLARYDVQGSIAHVQMLGESGLMQPEQAATAIEGLTKIASEIEAGRFEIEPGVEDIHSQVELLLTRRIGDIGKMIHSGRSRNDQVAVAIKLFLKDACLQLKSELSKVFELLIEKSNQFKDILIPGYTHLQVAMPSSVGLWLGAYSESLADDVSLLYAAYKMCNKNPLGSGAGYGSSFPLNRKRTTELLKFETLHWNSIYAQMSRGKTEKFVANAIAAIASSLARLAMDCCLYLSQNFNFISFPEALTTGSSIMPHKKNPDVFELIRGKCNRLQSIPNELNLLLANLPSGYHRELQLTKEILFPAIDTLMDCLQMTHLMMAELQVKDNVIEEERYRYIFSVEVLNQLVLDGVPFREAYQQVAAQIELGDFRFSGTLQHTHEGSIGNLCNDEIVKAFRETMSLFESNT